VYDLTRRRSYHWRRWLYHFLNGIWTGIPLCCTLYWCSGYHGMNRDKPDPWHEAYYVRCNACVDARRINKTRQNGRVAHWLIGD